MVKGLLYVISSLALFMEFAGDVEFALFVILITILAASGIFCDSPDG